MLPDKFKIKGAVFDLNKLVEKREDFVRSWERSLGHQIRDLPDVSDVFEEVLTFLKRIGVR